jgi:hypothetical protein
MKSIKGIFIFVIGVVSGTFVGAQIAKKKYEEIANEEIEEIRAYYKERATELPEQTVEMTRDEEEPKVEEIEIIEERKQYDNIIKRGNYMAVDEEEQNNVCDEAYPIDPSEFGNDGKNATETLTYFADGVLVNEVDEVIEDPDLVVGRHHIDIFNEFPDATCVYVRNDLDGTDYEILKDDWCWSDFNEKGYAPPIEEKPEKKPHQL